MIHAIIKVEKSIHKDRNELNTIANDFNNILIKQRTPLRVVHRRADKIRTRKVISFEVENIEDQEITVYIVCEGGLYVKELISGDQGRTQPSFSGRLENPAKVTKLDVIEVFKNTDPL